MVSTQLGLGTGMFRRNTRTHNSSLDEKTLKNARRDEGRKRSETQTFCLKPGLWRLSGVHLPSHWEMDRTPFTTVKLASFLFVGILSQGNDWASRGNCMDHQGGVANACSHEN
jgi:hypothetical protein